MEVYSCKVLTFVMRQIVGWFLFLEREMMRASRGEEQRETERRFHTQRGVRRGARNQELVARPTKPPRRP